MNLLIALLLAVQAPAPPARTPVTVTDFFVSYNVLDGAGEVALAVNSRLTITDTVANHAVETTFKTPRGGFILKTDRHPAAVGESLITASIKSVENGAVIEYDSGPEEPHVPALGEDTQMVLGHQVIRCGPARLEFSEITDADLFAGKISTKELAAFRDAVPDSLRDFCETLVEASDLLGADVIPTLMARLAAPKGARLGVAAAHGWYKGEETRKTVRKSSQSSRLKFLLEPRSRRLRSPGSQSLRHVEA